MSGDDKAVNADYIRVQATWDFDNQCFVQLKALHAGALAHYPWLRDERGEEAIADLEHNRRPSPGYIHADAIDGSGDYLIKMGSRLMDDFKTKAATLPLATATPDQLSGFVQYEDKKQFVLDRGDSLTNLRVGQVLRINFIMANRGFRPVEDVQGWGVIGIVDPNKNPGKQVRRVLLKSTKTNYKQSKGAGGALGVNQSIWSTAFGTPITQAELDGLTDHSLRIHFMAFGAWTDEHNRQHYWTHCEWTNWPGDATPDNWVWKNC